MLIVVGNQKGGVGKTTITALLANALSQKPFSRSVFAADLDRQGSLTRKRLAELRTYDLAPPYRIEPMNMAQLEADLDELQEVYDIALVDHGGRLDAGQPVSEQEITRLMAYADVLLVPVSPGNYATDATADYLSAALAIQRQRRDTMRIVVFGNMVEAGTIDARELRADLVRLGSIPGVDAMGRTLGRYALLRAADTLTSFYEPGSADKARASFTAWCDELVGMLSI